MGPRQERYQTTALGRTGHWLAWTISFVIGPALYALLQPHYGQVRALLAALGCLTVGTALDLRVAGPKAHLPQIFARLGDRSRNLRYAAVCGVGTLMGIWASVATHELEMLFFTIVSGADTAYWLYLAKTSNQ